MALIRASSLNISFIFFSLFILLVTISLHLTTNQTAVSFLQPESPPEQTAGKIPKWFEFVSKNLKEKKNIKIGLVNANKTVTNFDHGLTETVAVQFDHVPNDLKWEDFFPNWIDEDERFRQQSCPEIPMPGPDNYRELDVVVAEVPCGNAAKGEGVRDVVRLQVNLLVANLVVWNGWKDFNQDDRTVYVVFIGPCGPMWEIFRCDDLVYNERDVLVYKPDLRRMKQKVLMPVGSCRIAPPIAESGQFSACFFLTYSL